MIKDTNYQTTGAALTSIGGLVIVAAPGPVGLAVGGALMLTGGLMSLFGPEKKPEPSAELLELRKISAKLDKISRSIDKLQKSVDKVLEVVRENNKLLKIKAHIDYYK